MSCMSLAAIANEEYEAHIANYTAVANPANRQRNKHVNIT